MSPLENTDSDAAPWLWIRHETRPDEYRVPLVPDDAARLRDQGATVTVEESAVRAIPIADYERAGAEIVPAGSWTQAPPEAWIVGLKELPEGDEPLRHRHVFFGHAYKGQQGAESLLGRFARGGGQLWDLEYLVDSDGRRLAAFGRWAGYVGAALAVWHATGVLPAPLTPGNRGQWHDALGASGAEGLHAVVTGARGRSGGGAVEALQAAGAQVSAWDLAETADLDRAELLAHDLLVNCVLATEPAEPFVRVDDLAEASRRLRVLSDVTCDIDSGLSLVPVNDRLTSWEEPVHTIAAPAGPDLDVIAIDNLPSLLPAEASASFSADLAPHLLRLGDAGPDSPWATAAALFRRHAGVA